MTRRHLTALLAAPLWLRGADRVPSLAAARRQAPPAWALLQRRLMRAIEEAAPVYWDAVTERGGTLRRGGKVDDDYESFASWPLFYAIGGSPWILDRSIDVWNGITRQWTERGSLRGEFVKHYDMLHTSEGYVGFQYFSLADPHMSENVRRARRFAGFYLNEDPEAPNYDPAHRLIRCPLNGSAGPQFSADAKYVLDYGHASLYPLVERLELGWDRDPVARQRIQKLYDDVVLRGDVPMNLAVCGLIAHAALLTGDSKYRQWIVDYTGAWRERIQQNQGILPDNVGLTGKIGEYRRGQWWGGFFGWSGRYSVEMIFNALITAAECALLVTGDAGHLEMLRSQIDMLLAQSVVRDGDLLVPYKMSPAGWSDFRPLEPHILSHLWHASLDPRDWARIERVREGSKHGPRPYAYADSPEPPPPGAEVWRPDGSLVDWTEIFEDPPHRNQYRHNEPPHLMFLAGKNPDWPVRVLEADYRQVLRCVERIRNPSWEHPWRSQTVTEKNPVLTTGLAQVTMGAPFTCFNGGLLRAVVRYFDDEARRPGLPPDVAALVESIRAPGAVVHLVNLHPAEDRRVVLQAGAFGEHRFTTAKPLHGEGAATEVEGKLLRVHLPAGTSLRLELGMRRFVNRPSYALPWDE